LAARSASFLQAFCRLGLVPDAGGTWFLPRLAGSARAMGMAMLGEPLSAETAAQWGLIWKVVDDDKLMAEARGLAAKLAQGPTAGLGLIKQALNRSLANSLDAQLDVERDFQRLAALSEDFKEGVAAFLEKRPAKFKGR
jgi:2-(1,2-epoxy-1,2-dihydrophenyl)acetyl-CoA isomerase